MMLSKLMSTVQLLNSFILFQERDFRLRLAVSRKNGRVKPLTIAKYTLHGVTIPHGKQNSH